MLVPVFFGFLCFIGCGDKRNWSHAHRSTSDLGQAIVKSISNHSENNVNENLRYQTEDLHKHRVSKTEYLGWVLPAFPETHFPQEFVWDNLNKKCIVGVQKWAKQFQNQKLEFVSLDFEQEPIPYEGFRLLRGTILSVKDDRGQVLRLDILGSVIEKSGEYKLLSYKD